MDGRRILVIEAPSASVDLVRKKMASAKLDEVRIVRSIPMDNRHNAKVDYVALRRLIAKSK